MSSEKKMSVVFEADSMTVGRIVRQAEKEGLSPSAFVENFFEAWVADTSSRARKVADTSAQKPA